MEVQHRKESKNIGGLVLIVLAAFALIIIAASGIGRSVVSTDRSAAPVAVAPATTPAAANKPAATPPAPAVAPSTTAPATTAPPKAPSP